MSGPTDLFSDVIQGRDSTRSMSRSIFGHRCLALERVTYKARARRARSSCVSGFRPGCRSRGSGTRSDGFQRFSDLRFDRDFLIDYAGTKRLKIHWALQEELKSAVRIPLAPLDVEISSNSTVRRAGNLISRDSEEVMKRTQNK